LSGIESVYYKSAHRKNLAFGVIKMVKMKLFALIALSLCLSVSASGQIFKIFKKKNKDKKVEKTVEVPTPAVTKVEIEKTSTDTTQTLAVDKIEETPKSVTEAKPIEKTAVSTSDKSTEPQLTTDKDSENYRYRIGLLDQIQVTVNRHPELSDIYNVSEQGTISIPRSKKQIYVVCKTENQVADEIRDEYKSFLRDPYVNARVAQQNSQPVAVFGAVEKPSNFYLTRRMKLLELIAFAGGPKIEKAGTKVQIARVGGVSGCSQSDKNEAEDSSLLLNNLFAYYKLKDVYENRQNPWMRPGDIVRVLEAEEVYVIGNVVETTKKIELRDNLTVTQAIAKAGGILAATKKDKVVIRRIENEKSIEIAVDLDKIEKRQIPDIKLLADDIIYVPTDKVKGILVGIKNALTQGIPTLVTRLP
jgi:polysaccharide biosynthesis/export protein